MMMTMMMMTTMVMMLLWKVNDNIKIMVVMMI